MNRGNNTRINGANTKEKIITFQKNPHPIPHLNINGTVIKRVKSSKLLGLIIYNALKWHLIVDSICSYDYVDRGWSIWNLSSTILVLL